jgi:hypothetical protein
MAGQSRSKNGVASLAYDPAIRRPRKRTSKTSIWQSGWIAGSSPAMTKLACAHALPRLLTGNLPTCFARRSPAHWM